MDIKFSGFGGQGIIKAGSLVGAAASLYDNKFATLTQSFGPEARGGACSAQLIVSDTPVLYPYLVQPEILVAMSQEAYEKFVGDLKPGGILLTDVDLVIPAEEPKGVRWYSFPATRIAEEMGNRLFANVAMIGFFTSITGVVSTESVMQALPDMIPARFIESNTEAFNRGYETGLKLIGMETDSTAAVAIDN